MPGIIAAIVASVQLLTGVVGTSASEEQRTGIDRST
jgi:hypothetical protein